MTVGELRQRLNAYDASLPVSAYVDGETLALTGHCTYGGDPPKSVILFVETDKTVRLLNADEERLLEQWRDRDE